MSSYNACHTTDVLSAPSYRDRRVPSQSDANELKEHNNNNDGEVKVENVFSKLTLDAENSDLYSSSLLKSLDFDTVAHKFKNGVSINSPGEGLIIRPLKETDFNLGFISLLSQLTSVGPVSQSLFSAQYFRMKRCGDYYVTVIEDRTLSRIAAAATLVLERKFIHECGVRGRVEDVVVHHDYRGKQLGKLLVETLTLLSKKLDCYKVSLECKDKLIEFYCKAGYEKDLGNNFMVQRL